MRISGLLDNAAAIASFGLPLEPLQRILYASLDHLAAKCFEYPCPPTWRENEVSAILHEAGDGVNRCASGGLIVCDAQSAKNPMDLMLLGIHRLDLERTVPPQRVFQIDYLSGRGFPLRHDAHRARMPPFIPKCWLREQLPDSFNGGCDNCHWADGESHKLSSFIRWLTAAQPTQSRRHERG